MRNLRIVTIFFSMMLIFGLLGLAATVQAETPQYVILTAFTDQGESTWSTPVVVVDLDTLGHPTFVTLKVDNVSTENFGFRVDGLDILATVPVGETRLIQVPTNTPGIYRMYSDLHTGALATKDLIQKTRPHVSGWLVIGSKSEGDQYYLDMAKHFGKALESALSQVQRHELLPQHFTAFTSECKIQLEMLRWATNALWNPHIAFPEDRALTYGELYAIVNHEIQPTFHDFVRQMSMKQVPRHASLSRAIKKLKEVQDLIDSIPRGA